MFYVKSAGLARLLFNEFKLMSERTTNGLPLYRGPRYSAIVFIVHD